jgi:ABC-type transport system involved in cytochrome c biogenesis permease subunit
MQPDRLVDAAEVRRGDTDPLVTMMWRALEAVASLKLTVLLFVLAIILVYIGTLAQVEMDIWDVVHGYFRTTYVIVPFQVLFPVSFFPSLDGQIPGAFPFPGGILIGGAMAVNLLAAHAIRFKIQARGGRLIAGLAVMLLGAAAFCVVVASGFSHSGILESSIIPWHILWRSFVGLLVLTWTGMAYACFQLGAERHWERIFLIAATVLLGAVTLWLVFQGDSARLDDSGMRILWQLLKGEAVALILLAGCYLLFKKRAGIVLLHGGIGVVMLTEVVVSFWAVEGQMQILEGETVNYVMDGRTYELAVVDRSDAKEDLVVSVPKPLLTDEGAKISNSQLPFDIEVLEFYENSDLVDSKLVKQNPATAGFGLLRAAEERRLVSGTDTSERKNVPSMYVRLVDKESKRDHGVHLFSLWLRDQPVEIDGKKYEVGLRYRRTYKPYSLTLLDASRDEYVGTRTPKNYSSDVYLLDPTRNVDREKVHIWMNNPLRFAGETFYQSGMDIDPETGVEYTVLSVVSNFGWMIPYIGCMIVGTGMFFQFGNTLLRFLGRMNRQSAGVDAPAVSSGTSNKARRREAEFVVAAQSDARIKQVSVWAATLTVLLAAACVTYSMTKPVKDFDGMNLSEFGKIPVAHQGRVKPLDTLARNTLRILSGKLEFKDNADVRQPAIRWLADWIARPEVAMRHKVFRIDHPELLETLGLKRREKHLYALSEFEEKLSVLEEQAGAARETRLKNPRGLSDYQRKVLELEEKLGEVIALTQAFATTTLRPERLREDAMVAMQREDFLEHNMAPLVVPPIEGGVKADDETTQNWTAFSSATFALSRRELLRAHGGEEAAKAPMANIQVSPAVERLTRIFEAYAKKDPTTFNREIAAYRSELAAAPPPMYYAQRIGIESRFNRAEPFYYTSILYAFAFTLAILGLFGNEPSLRWFKVFQTSAFWLLAFCFVIHTAAIVTRMFISRYAPVTNLYSSAIFIGWACVGVSLGIESIYRFGIASLVASVSGFTTLLIAHYLSLDGDTIGVMQAVLDTQFWLSTHVVTVALGYMATMVAGLFGVAFIMLGVLTPLLPGRMQSILASVIYCIVCFAIFFSFIGTVLGGLWADDSWGRFWGWDPKENGALIIVLWNALVLHARWGKMVGDRGLAVLAVLGNICVAWSWFGVNELGVGLHSYGFTDGVLMWLGIAIVAHLTVAGIGLLPKRIWLSTFAEENRPVAATLVN